MNLSDRNYNDEYSAEEVRELYEVIDRSKKAVRNAYMLTGFILLLSFAVLFSNPFSNTPEPENPTPAINLEQNTLVQVLSDQNSFLRDQLGALQDDIRNDEANAQSQLSSKDQELDTLKSEMLALQQELIVSQNMNTQIQSDNSTETLEEEIAGLTLQIEEKTRENDSLTIELSGIVKEVNELLNDTTGAISESVKEEINSLREMIENNTAQEIVIDQEAQISLLSDEQIQFRDRLKTFIPILLELHKEILQVELNARNEIETLTLDKLEMFRANTRYGLGSQAAQLDYQESLKDFWNFPQIVETIDILLVSQESQEGFLQPGVDLIDIASKISDLQNRQYETSLFLATITTFLSQVDTSPLSKQEPSYPERAAQRGITGQVNIEFAITPLGTVDEETINVLSGNNQLADASVEALKQAKHAVNPVPDYIRRDISTEALRNIKLFGFTQTFIFELED